MRTKKDKCSSRQSPTHQAYVLIHDSSNQLILAQNAIISTWANLIKKEDISEPITSNDVEIGKKRLNGLPKAQMLFARNHPKQYTFIGGAAYKKTIFNSALSQMRDEAGLVIKNGKLCGFEGHEICNVKT